MADQRQLEGRVALITGGGRGIGRAIALAYAAEGAKLALAARTESELRDTAEAITTRHGTDVHTVIADVSSRQQVDNAVATTLERFGAIDVLVNNAGNLGPVGVLWENDPDEWEQTIAIHVLGTFYGCRAVIPHMLERGAGRIVNMSGRGRPQRHRLRGRQDGNHQPHREPGLGVGRHAHHGERHQPRVHTHAHVGGEPGLGVGDWRHCYVRTGSPSDVGPRRRRLKERPSWWSSWAATPAENSRDG